MDTAKNGREGLEKMMKARYSVVLMDFLMPVLDGISATAMFRSWEREHRGGGDGGGESDPASASLQLVVGISANAETGDLEAARSAGIDHFIPKPVKVAEIVQFVKSFAEGHPGASAT